MILQTSFTFRFADVEVHEPDLRVIRSGEPIAIEPKAFRVLIYLLRHAGHLVTKDELLTAVWGEIAVTDNSLTRAIALLRRLLDDDPHQPRFIETVSTAGYRFICPVESGIPESAEGSANAYKITKSPADEPLAEKKHSLKRAWIAACSAIVFLVIVGGLTWLTFRPPPAPHITDITQLTLDGRSKDAVGTDGSRLYLNLQGDIAQVPITGGAITSIPIELPTKGGLWGISSLSPDGSSFLIYDHLDSKEGANISVVGSLGHPVRHLTHSFPAVWSPDGRSVLYAIPNGSVYSMPAEGGQPHLIFSSPDSNGEEIRTDSLSWSPDGSKIRFTRNRVLWEMNSDGADLHVLLPDWKGKMQCCGRWTRDGRYYLFLSGSTLARGPLSARVAQIWALDERRRALSKRPTPIQLTAEPLLWGTPVPSQDGRKIYARGVALRGELVRYDKQTSHFDPYLNGESAEMLAFSKDGNFVAYVSYPSGILWRANRDGSGLLQLTRPPFYPKDVRWSPDGSQIVFTDSSQNGVDTIYVVPSNGGTPERLIPQEAGAHGDPTWSPDGKKVVYSTFNPTFLFNHNLPATSETRIFDLVTRTTVVLPARPEGFWSPRWSPDGRYIAGFPYSMDNLTIFDLQTQTWKNLLRKSIVGFPNWSKDGTSIYFVRFADDRGIYRVRVADKNEERIADLKGFRYTGWYSVWMGLDPDDTPLMLRDAGTDEIYALNLETR